MKTYKLKDKMFEICLGLFFFIGISLTIWDNSSKENLIGTSKGYKGPIEVEVTLRGEKIIGIKILKENDTEGIKEKAFRGIINGVITKQSIAIDSIAGASYSSVGLKKAILNAVEPKKILNIEEVQPYLEVTSDFFDND
ncbi:FMN-binding protein [Psychrilyobacter atlanticus]|uniref:FMN-binding protein n=1 Tax=Psychrilyobacter atlanticus TaxID=271091 RepID=UPI000417823C|nr:FMN-binding protein [Psychrilyobacter atlanticus]